MAFYRTATGQLVLAVFMAIFVLLLVVMRRMTTTPPTPRFTPAHHQPHRKLTPRLPDTIAVTRLAGDIGCQSRAGWPG